MAEASVTSLYEARLLREIEEINKRIKDLEDEKRALQRLVAHARGRDAIAHSVKRKNSVDRIVFETAVREALSEGKPLSARQLFRKIAEVLHSMNESTFRSHLHRMKKKGVIKNYRGQRGHWELAGGSE